MQPRQRRDSNDSFESNERFRTLFLISWHYGLWINFMLILYENEFIHLFIIRYLVHLVLKFFSFFHRCFFIFKKFHLQLMEFIFFFYTGFGWHITEIGYYIFRYRKWKLYWIWPNSSCVQRTSHNFLHILNKMNEI